MEAVKEADAYSSPVHKLLSFFQKSRDRWKTKALERKRHIRRLEKRLVDVEASRGTWKAKAKAQPASPVVHDEQETKGT
jgi:hypothetical protein